MQRYPNISFLHCYPKNISNIKKMVVEIGDSCIVIDIQNN